MTFLDSLHIEANCRDGANESSVFSRYHAIRYDDSQDALDCEFSTLNEESVHGTEGYGVMRTAKTLNNDVLPAFCNPIMVISISVALKSRKVRIS